MNPEKHCGNIPPAADRPLLVNWSSVPDNPSNTATAPATTSSLSLSGLQALLESARLLNSSLSLDELLRHLLRTVMGRLLVSRGVIAIENHGEMRVELAHLPVVL